MEFIHHEKLPAEKCKIIQLVYKLYMLCLLIYLSWNFWAEYPAKEFVDNLNSDFTIREAKENFAKCIRSKFQNDLKLTI